APRPARNHRRSGIGTLPQVPHACLTGRALLWSPLSRHSKAGCPLAGAGSRNRHRGGWSMKKVALVLGLCATALSACVSQSQWTPTVDTYGSSRAQFVTRDQAECRQLAMQVSGSTAGQATRGAVGGGLLGAAAGAGIGAAAGNAGRGALAGGAVGALGG